MYIEHEEVPATFTLASTSHCLEPIMPLVEGTHWLQEFFEREPAFIPGDDLGTCFCSYAAVILSAMVIGTESPLILAGVTAYPAPFVAAVCNSMRCNDLWSLENTTALNTTVADSE